MDEFHSDECLLWHTGHRATASISNCDISFNKKAGVVMGGGGAVSECMLWGNGPMQAGGDPVNVHVDNEHVWGDCVFDGNHTLGRLPLTPKEAVCAAFLDQAAHLAHLPPLQPQAQPLHWYVVPSGGSRSVSMHVWAIIYLIFAFRYSRDTDNMRVWVKCVSVSKRVFFRVLYAGGECWDTRATGHTSRTSSVGRIHCNSLR